MIMHFFHLTEFHSTPGAWGLRLKLMRSRSETNLEYRIFTEKNFAPHNLMTDWPNLNRQWHEYGRDSLRYSRKNLDNSFKLRTSKFEVQWNTKKTTHNNLLWRERKKMSWFHPRKLIISTAKCRSNTHNDILIVWEHHWRVSERWDLWRWCSLVAIVNAKRKVWNCQ